MEKYPPAAGREELPAGGGSGVGGGGSFTPVVDVVDVVLVEVGLVVSVGIVVRACLRRAWCGLVPKWWRRPGSAQCRCPVRARPEWLLAEAVGIPIPSISETADSTTSRVRSLRFILHPLVRRLGTRASEST
jgi:hypothetical protein